MKVSKKKLVTYIGIVAILGVGVFGMSTKHLAKQAADTGVAAKSVGSISVETQPVQTMRKAATLSYNATLEAGEEGVVSSKVGGKVVRVLVDNGAYVAQGTPLVKLDDTDLRGTLRAAQQQLAIMQTALQSAQNQLLSAQAGLQKQRLSVENAQRTYNQTKALYDLGASTKSDLDTAESTVRSAKADLATATVNINTSKIAVQTARDNVAAAQITVANDNTALANAIIRAPIAGIVDEKAVNVGQFISAGTVLAKVKDVSSLNAVIQVKQSDIALLRAGMQAQIKASSTATQTYAGTLQSLGVSADAASRMFSCKITVPNAARALHPGDFVIANLASRQKTEVICVPVQALSGSDGAYYVFVYTGGVAKKTEVTVADISGDQAEIPSGLQKGQQVIVTNLSVLQDGSAVTVPKTEETGK